MSDNVESLLVNFIDETNRYWAGNQRQIDKLTKRLERNCTSLDVSPSKLIRLLCNVAETRIKNHSKTLYLPNIGSSGSHLLEKSVANSYVSVPLGEIYIAENLIPLVKKLDAGEREIFSEVYQLLHARSLNNIFDPTSLIVNTVHNPVLSRYKHWSKNYKAILIIRNPKDVVKSRTFRKNEYKNYLAKEEGYLDYLYRNIKLVKNFYDKALNFGYKATVRFEEFFNDPQSTSTTIASELTGCPKINSLQHALVTACETGKGTNKYVGDNLGITSGFISIIDEELDTVSKRLGY